MRNIVMHTVVNPQSVFIRSSNRAPSRRDAWQATNEYPPRPMLNGRNRRSAQMLVASLMAGGTGLVETALRLETVA